MEKQQKQRHRQRLLDVIMDLLRHVDAASFGATHLERPTPRTLQILQVAVGSNKSSRPHMPAGPHRCPAGHPIEPWIGFREGKFAPSGLSPAQSYMSEFAPTTSYIQTAGACLGDVVDVVVDFSCIQHLLRGSRLLLRNFLGPIKIQYT